MKLGNIKEGIIFYRLKDRDRDAFVRAYDQYFDDIYRFIYFKVGNKEDAEDLCSSVFLKAWDHIQNNSISEYETLKALFYKVARNAVIDHYRKKSNNQTLSLDTEIENGDDYLDEKADIGNAMDLKMDVDLVKLKLMELKDEYRETIVLRFINDMDIADMAKILDKTKGNVRVLIHRSLEALKKIINQDDKI